jgi:hypothetical protein
MMIKATAFPLLAVLVCFPAAAHAQESLGGWRGLNLSSLNTIYVTDDTGRQTEGKLLRIEPESLVMLVAGAEQRFDVAQVRRIDRRGDSLKNGTLIGVGIGVALGLVTAGISDCIDGDGPGSSCVGGRILVMAVSTGIYAAIGAGVDALIVGRTRVYDAGRSTGAVRNLSGPQLAFRISW